MTDHEDDGLDALENEPVFICSQLQVGETLTQREVDAIQAILSELDKRENEDVDNFGDGRECGIREIGGEELLAAVKAKDDAYITKVVRETIAKMETRTAALKAATLPEPPPSPQPNRLVTDAMGRALVAKYRDFYPGKGWPTLEDAKEMIAAALATTEGSEG